MDTTLDCIDAASAAARPRRWLPLRFGCDLPPEWCQTDHILEWDADHGPTDIQWLILLCVYHHHFRHRPDVHLHGNANNLSVTLPDGRTVPLPARGPTLRKSA